MIPNLEINIKESIIERKKNIILMYLDMEEGIFKNSVQKILEKFNITQRELNSIVDDNSKVFLDLGNCDKCSDIIKLSVRTRTQINEIKKLPFYLCSECKELIEQDVDRYTVYMDKVKA
ncbi:hypothetical protein, partial [Tenacibaculum ovolyticum]|uniref:hypothetical protein n=1 Tax=Tenacibaculum ovolyticum TaxID=104270 RepID=UPI0012F9144C